MRQVLSACMHCEFGTRIQFFLIEYVATLIYVVLPFCIYSRWNKSNISKRFVKNGKNTLLSAPLKNRDLWNFGKYSRDSKYIAIRISTFGAEAKKCSQSRWLVWSLLNCHFAKYIAKKCSQSRWLVWSLLYCHSAKYILK